MKQFNTSKETGFKAVENNIPETVKSFKRAKCPANAPMIFMAVMITIIVTVVVFTIGDKPKARDYMERNHPHMWDRYDQTMAPVDSIVVADSLLINY